MRVQVPPDLFVSPVLFSYKISHTALTVLPHLTMIRYLATFLLLATTVTARNLTMAGTEHRDLEIPSSGKFIELDVRRDMTVVILYII